MPQKTKFKLKPLNISKETIGERIAKIRKEKGFTQLELAKEIGITRSHVSKYEIGWIRLYDEMLIRFALALDVSLDYLVGLKDELEPFPKK